MRFHVSSTVRSVALRRGAAELGEDRFDGGRGCGAGKNEELGADGSDGQAHGAPLGGAEIDVHGR